MSALPLALILVLCFEVPISATSSQYVCIGLGGWPCGYTGPFTGNYYAGYAALGCTPTVPNGTCVVPQVAIETSYLVISNASYVVDWANESFQFGNRLADGSTVSVSGKLDAIFYNKTAGSTYMIYYSNANGLWNPQPQLQIENATLTTQSVTLTCTTTLSFTVSWSSNAVGNLPMIPAGACYTVREIAPQQSQTAGDMYIPMRVISLASIGVVVIIAATLAFLTNRRKQNNS
jgi:hypothetical protein